MVLPNGLNGAEIARRARTMRPDLPIVYMSGYVADVEGPLEPAAPLLQKPFTIAALARAMSDEIGD